MGKELLCPVYELDTSSEMLDLVIVRVLITRDRDRAEKPLKYPESDPQARSIRADGVESTLLGEEMQSIKRLAKVAGEDIRRVQVQLGKEHYEVGEGAAGIQDGVDRDVFEHVVR